MWPCCPARERSDSHGHLQQGVGGPKTLGTGGAASPPVLTWGVNLRGASSEEPSLISAGRAPSPRGRAVSTREATKVRSYVATIMAAVTGSRRPWAAFPQPAPRPAAPASWRERGGPPALTVSEAGSPVPRDMAAALPGRLSPLQARLSGSGAPRAACSLRVSPRARRDPAAIATAPAHRAPDVEPGEPGRPCACPATPAGPPAVFPGVRGGAPRRAELFTGFVHALLV